MVNILLEKKAIIDAKSNLEYTPLRVAVQSDRPAVVQLLLSKGANIDAGDKIGRTPLQYAVLMRNTAMFELLVNNRANVERADKFERRPLDMAVCMGDETIVKCCLIMERTSKLSTLMGGSVMPYGNVMK